MTQTVSHPVYSGYFIPFHNFFLGKYLRFGAGMLEKHLRLFLKANARYGTEAVHEGIRVGERSCPITHCSYRNVEEYLTKCNFYTSLLAKKKYSTGARFHVWHHLRFPFELFFRYVVKLGFLDGSVGFMYAVLSSYYVWLKYIKLRDLERGRE